MRPCDAHAPHRTTARYSPPMGLLPPVARRSSAAPGHLPRDWRSSPASIGHIPVRTEQDRSRAPMVFLGCVVLVLFSVALAYSLLPHTLDMGGRP